MLTTFVLFQFLFLGIAFIISRKFSFKRYTWAYISVYILYLPASTYIAQFWDHPLSDDPVLWGVFGDFIGGTYNVLTSVLIAYISYRMSKFKTQNEKSKKAAKELLEQIQKLKSNNYHHHSLQKLLRIVKENKYNIDKMLEENILFLYDSYTCYKETQMPINKSLENVVISKLNSIVNG